MSEFFHYMSDSMIDFRDKEIILNERQVSRNR